MLPVTIVESLLFRGDDGAGEKKGAWAGPHLHWYTVYSSSLLIHVTADCWGSGFGFKSDIYINDPWQTFSNIRNLGIEWDTSLL